MDLHIPQNPGLDRRGARWNETTKTASALARADSARNPRAVDLGATGRAASCAAKKRRIVIVLQSGHSDTTLSTTYGRLPTTCAGAKTISTDPAMRGRSR
jgi:hypothetical protein